MSFAGGQPGADGDQDQPGNGADGEPLSEQGDTEEQTSDLINRSEDGVEQGVGGRTRLRRYLAMAGGEATVKDDDISPRRRH